MARLNEHLIAKIEDHRDELELVDADLDPGATTLVLSYGVTAGAARAAVQQSRDEGTPMSFLVVHSLWPIPETALGEALEGIDRVIVPELNMGLYRREIERIAGDREVIGVNRIDGELITAPRDRRYLPMSTITVTPIATYKTEDNRTRSVPVVGTASSWTASTRP